MEVNIHLKSENEDTSLSLFAQTNPRLVEVAINPKDGGKILTAIVSIEELKIALRKIITK